jgi:PAS domain S-box-containing protein
MSLLSSYAWNDWRPLGKVPALSFPDLCYLTDYALLTVAYAVAFLRYGGSLRDPRTWLDVLTVVVALLGSFWGTFLGTFQPSAHGQHVGISYALAYSTSLSLWMAMATLLFLRMPSLRLMPMLLVGAGLVDAIWEVGWLATWLTDHNYVGLYYNFGDVLCFTMIAAAAGITPQRPDPQERVVSAERSVYEFLPTLSVLVAIALVGATLASTRASEAWILVGLVTLTALLLVTRQAAARRKLAELNRVLAVRAADARVTELVRQSSDAILVIDARGLVAFASPATETIIGVAPPKVIGTSAALLLGAEHREAIERFLRRLKAESTPPTSLELPVEVPFGPPRILKLHGTNRLSNAHIDGLTLTISDVSEQRGLERDVLTAANHERLRLAGDIHDGLGQELSGIALMLQGLAKSPNLGVAQQQAELRTITAHVTQAISGARDLARGLSPIYVVRGSLCDALRRLGREVGNTPPVHVEVDRRLVDWAFDELPADHLYRIAREAVQNACRHGSCSRIDVRLRMNDDTLLLEVTDDGVGYGHPATTDSGFGLRLMEYRARVIGASFEIGPRPEGGTSVRVRVGASVVAEESKTGVIH